MERLYDRLNDEQKAQRTALGNRHRESKPAASLAQNCTAAQSGLRPVGEIEQALRRTEAQRVSLAELQSTTDGAAEMLQACPSDESLTPPARLQASGAWLTSRTERRDDGRCARNRWPPA